ncbi:MAG: HyaD/HybD family hydrogenase maturation endopeptidase [Candidatus Nitrospinota bacterium M3_3B_026]
MGEGAKGQIAVIGVGNVLLSDEGLGVRAAERLMAEYDFPENVEVYDGGVTGMMGLLPIIEEADSLVILDAVNGPGEPGTLYRHTLDDFRKVIPKKMSIHDVGVMECLAIAQVTGRLPRSVIILGMKPGDMTTPGMRLTDTVEKRIGELARMAVDELAAMGSAPTPQDSGQKTKGEL